MKLRTGSQRPGHGLGRVVALLMAMAVVAAAPTRLGAQHAHVNAGAIGSVAGNPLYFANGTSFVTNSGYFLPLKLETNGPYAGHHVGAVTLTALPSTGDNGGPAFGHAAPGTRIEAVIDSVRGPDGGRFGFWDSDGFEDATALTFEVPVGTTGGTRAFRLSENDGSPGADPYGHVHGRRFSANAPGLYLVQFRLVDTGGNGPGGGPLHPASEPIPMYFQAGVTLGGIAAGPDGVRVHFAAERGRTYRLQRRLELEGPESAWEDAVAPIVGRGLIEVVEGIPATAETAWFRLRVE